MHTNAATEPAITAMDIVSDLAASVGVRLTSTLGVAITELIWNEKAYRVLSSNRCAFVCVS